MEEALDKIPRQLPDIVLSDIGLPGMSGIEGVRVLKERYPDLLLLMLTVYDDDERIFDAMCAGASGYLLKKTPPARLLDSLKEAVAGGAPMSPEVARRVIALFREIRPPERADYQLTPHETRLLKLFVEGHNYKTAATELGVSVNTVNFHVRNIYENCKFTRARSGRQKRSSTASSNPTNTRRELTKNTRYFVAALRVPSGPAFVRLRGLVSDQKFLLAYAVTIDRCRTTFSAWSASED